MRQTANVAAEFARITDEEFGRAVVRRAVTPERITKSLAGLAEKRIGIGPLSSGPIGLARIAAEGRLGPARVSERPGDELAFTVTVPASLDFAVKLGAESTLRADIEIDLLFTPRPADPLLIAIDVAPVRGDDVRINLRGTGIAYSLVALLQGVSDELGRAVAHQVSGRVAGDGLRKSRTFDIAARIDGRRGGEVPESWTLIDHATFGRRFVERAVNADRVAAGFARLAGQEIAIGPLRTGPRDLATVRAQGAVGTPAVWARPRGYEVMVPLQLELTVDLTVASRYDVAARIPLVVTPTPAAALRIVIDIAPVEPDNVQADVRPRSTIAGLLGRVGNIREQVQRQVAKDVNRRLADPAGRVIDIGARIDGAR